MADTHIKNPVEWSGATLAAAGRNLSGLFSAVNTGAPIVRPLHIRRIHFSDLRAALADGYADFSAYRSDVIFLCFVYAIAGVVLARMTLGGGLVPMLFPLASGFAILGPLFGVGLYEMSKRRGEGAEVSWTNAFAITREPGFANIVVLGFLLIGIFAAWLVTAWLLFRATMGPVMTISAPDFAHLLFTTAAGLTLIAAGCAAGFIFALFALLIGLVSFPLLLDDGNISLSAAIATSFRAASINPRPVAAWGLIVAGALLIGTLPLFLGLVFVLPVLGHATWHLYRRLVVRG